VTFLLLFLGGQNVETSESPAFAEPMNRKARVKSLFNSYEVRESATTVMFNSREINAHKLCNNSNLCIYSHHSH